VSPDRFVNFRICPAGPTPEYNHGIPGLLKNALDWASRPHGQSVLIGKPTVIISSSPAFTGGVRAQSQLHETLLSVRAVIVPGPGPQIVIGGVAHKVSDGRLVDQPSLSFALAAIDRLKVSIHPRASSIPSGLIDENTRLGAGHSLRNFSLDKSAPPEDMGGSPEARTRRTTHSSQAAATWRAPPPRAPRDGCQQLNHR
jgi:hypothetical protein